VVDRFALADLEIPIAAAPMAGGPSTPALAAAVSSNGGLGFLAGGMLSATALAESIMAVRALTAGPLGVNLFVPHQSVCDAEALVAYRRRIAREAARYNTALGTPSHPDFDWAAKVDLVCDMRPEVVSFTFGLPGQDVTRRLRAAGVLVVGTVTNLHEALLGVDHGVDALTVQGPMAGGHRATFDPVVPPSSRPLDDLLGEITDRVSLDVMAAGGLTGPAEVARVLNLGATAVQCGTAFLLADEAGTNPVHRGALRDSQFTHTAVTRAFTGRYARSLRNGFIDDHDAEAVSGFPEVAMLTAPVLAAAVDAGDPHGTSLWAGTAFAAAKSGPAAAILAGLLP
jgi:nitronate monooxygenase